MTKRQRAGLNNIAIFVMAASVMLSVIERHFASKRTANLVVEVAHMHVAMIKMGFQLELLESGEVALEVECFVEGDPIDCDEMKLQIQEAWTHE